jgi:hypothetical protein
MTGLAALLAAASVGLWRGGSARARGRLLPVAPPARPGRRAGRRDRRDRARDDPLTLALAVELVAACVEAGLPLPAALSAGSTVAAPTTAAALASTASALARGGTDQAWAACESHARLAPVVRICRRVGTTGAAVAGDLRRFAGELRRSDTAERRGRAQRAAVWVVLPLGLCFLPAFLLLTVPPVVVALLPGLR